MSATWVPFLLQPTKSPSSFLPRDLCTSVHLAGNAHSHSVLPIAGSFSLLSFQFKHQFLKEAVLHFPPPLHWSAPAQFNFFMALTTVSICLVYLLVYLLIAFFPLDFAF